MSEKAPISSRFLTLVDVLRSSAFSSTPIVDAHVVPVATGLLDRGMNMAERIEIFDLPEPEVPEPGLPVRIEHGCDYDFENGEISYYYNFLDYTWIVGGKDALARTYLDDHSRVAIYVPFDEVKKAAVYAPIIRFLQRRFDRIETFEKAEGRFVLRFRLRDAPESNADV